MTITKTHVSQIESKIARMFYLSNIQAYLFLATTKFQPIYCYLLFLEDKEENGKYEIIKKSKGPFTKIKRWILEKQSIKFDTFVLLLSRLCLLRPHSS